MKIFFKAYSRLKIVVDIFFVLTYNVLRMRTVIFIIL